MDDITPYDLANSAAYESDGTPVISIYNRASFAPAGKDGEYTLRDGVELPEAALVTFVIRDMIRGRWSESSD